MLPTRENKLQFLANYKSKSLIEILNPYDREIFEFRTNASCVHGRPECFEGTQAESLGNIAMFQVQE